MKRLVCLVVLCLLLVPPLPYRVGCGWGEVARYTVFLFSARRTVITCHFVNLDGQSSSTARLYYLPRCFQVFVVNCIPPDATWRVVGLDVSCQGRAYWWVSPICRKGW